MSKVTFALLAAVVTLHALPSLASACYRECSSAFNKKILELVPVTDTNIIRQKSCEAMQEQITCLKGRLSIPGACDQPSQRTVNNILNFIQPDYQNSCRNTTSPITTANSNATSISLLIMQCGQKVKECYDNFNSTFIPAAVSVNVTALCASLDQYTICAEQMMAECGQYMAGPVSSIRSLQQKYSAVCYAANSYGGEVMSECVNHTMQCYVDFNTTFVPAAAAYSLTGICSSIQDYSKCLSTVHARTVCHHFTNQALTGLATMQRQYSVVCGADGGQTSQKCMTEFQNCYRTFNNSFTPALQNSNTDVVCKSVDEYVHCVDRVDPGCSHQKAEAVRTGHLLKQMYSAQCDKKLQQLMACLPLRVCLNSFVSGSVLTTSPSPLCSRFTTFFPCVEASLKQCNVPHADTDVDFPALGKLTASFCQNLLGNTRLSMCHEFVTCTQNIGTAGLLTDFHVVFNGTTWCNYVDMALGCVERTLSGGLMGTCIMSNDQQIKGHLHQLQQTKQNVCDKKASSVPIPSASHEQNSKPHGNGQTARLDSESGAATQTSSAVNVAATATLISSFVQRLL